MILGPAGAGKTVLAHRLSACTGLPVIHLDRIFWRSGWQPAPRDEALAELESALAGDRWIADGNFLDAGDTRFARADTVIFLDLPRALCIWRVLWRRVRDRGRERPDLPALEGFDLPLLRWIWSYPRTEWPRVLALPNVRRLRSRHEVDEMIVRCA